MADLRVLIAATTLLAVTGCTGTGPGPAPLEPAPVAPATDPAISAPATDTQALPVEPAPIEVDFTRIENRTPAEVQSYLGAPSFVRRDENVQIMHFQNKWCVTEIIFYEPENGDHFRAEHLSARTPTGAVADLEACLKDILVGK